MKSIIALITTFILSVIAFGQDDLDLGTYKIPKNFGQPHDTHVTDDVVIINYCPYVPVTNMSLIKFGLYQYAPLKSGTEYTDKRIPVDEGIIQQSYYSGDTITEFVIYYKKGFPKYECTYAIRRRSCLTMALFGTEKKLATYQFQDPAEYTKMRLIHNGEEFAFVEMNKTSCSITFLSNDFEEINKIQIDEQTLASISCKECYYPQFNDDGSILLVFPDFKLGSIKENKDQILLVSQSGENQWFKMSGINSEDLIASYSNYKYNTKKKELLRVFFASSNSKDRKGYGVVKWNAEGNIIANNTTFLSFDDIFKNETEITSYFKANKLSTTDIWGRLEFSSFIRLMNLGNEDYIIIQKPHTTYELISATYVIKIDESANLDWIKPILSEIRDPMQFTSAKPFIKNGKLHFLVADYSTNTKKNEHVNLSFRKEVGTIAFFDLELNPADGSEILNERYDVETQTEMHITNIQMNEKALFVIVELEKEKQLSYKKFKL